MGDKSNHEAAAAEWNSLCSAGNKKLAPGPCLRHCSTYFLRCNTIPEIEDLLQLRIWLADPNGKCIGFEGIT
ncbi:hypothetical protein L484_004491 [Morus notabilis]|uniref:Uncharacterized protein n=1 Tax=Morus notabilis TaxID=981085 RepID=W9R7M4_9ROSA|nr:hypothetical protein L484_004491 [Morus notabilis]